MTSTLQENKRSDTPSLKGGGPVMTIEKLVEWTYRVQRADLMTAGMSNGPGSVISQLGSFTTLGSRVSGGGSFAGTLRLHDDALAVHEAAMKQGRVRYELLAIHGRFATRPDPRVGARWRIEPAEWRLEERWPGSGEYLRVPVLGWVRDKEKGTGPFIFTTEVDRPHEVEADRERWSEWRTGLVEVMALVASRLTAHRLEDTLPDEAPWMAGA